MKPETKEEIEHAIKEIKTLRSDYDHSFLSVEGANRFTGLFGIRAFTQVHHADRSPGNPRGLSLNNGATKARGASAEGVAEQIANTLGLSYPDKMGRGFRLQAATEAIIKHLEKKLAGVS